MRLKGKTVVHLVADEFEDIELLYPLIRLSEEGAKNIVVPIRGGLHTRPHIEGKPVTGRFGTTLPIPVMAPGKLYQMKELEEISVDEIDCLHFAGGYSPDYIRIHQPSLELTRKCHEAGKVIAGICHGPWIMISAGIIAGRRATGYLAVQDDVKNAGAEWVDEPAVIDGNIVTGRVPDDLTAYCAAIIEAMQAN